MARDAYVGLWSINAAGVVVQIFPNDHEPDHRLKAGQVRTIPGNKKYVFEPTTSSGLDHLWVVASTRPWNDLQAQRSGPFAVFQMAEEKKQWERHLRGIRVKSLPSGQGTEEAVSEQILPFRVRPGQE